MATVGFIYLLTYILHIYIPEITPRSAVLRKQFEYIFLMDDAERESQ